MLAWHNEIEAALGGDGRFNSHFHDPQKEEAGLDPELDHGFFGTHTNAIKWVLEGENLGLGRTNLYSLKEAFNYYRNSFVSTDADDRKSAQAALFVTLGHIVHILQDLHSPAHTRNDPHPARDPMEAYFGGHYKEDKGFYLRKGEFKGEFSNLAIEAISEFPSITYPSYKNFFFKEASITSKNFFSDDSFPPNFVHFEHPLPDINDIELVADGEIETDIVTGEITKAKYYIKPANPTEHSPEFLGIQHIETRIVEEGVYLGTDYAVLEDNALILMPRAVGVSEGFFDYFFRGRIEAKVTSDGDGIEITNISNPNLVNDPGLTNFQTNGVFEVYYKTDTGEHLPLQLLSDLTLGNRLPVDAVHTITGLSTALQNVPNLNEEGNLVILFDGDIGDERDLSNGEFGSERGLAVTKLNVGPNCYQANGYTLNSNDEISVSTGTGTGFTDSNLSNLASDVCETYATAIKTRFCLPGPITGGTDCVIHETFGSASIDSNLISCSTLLSYTEPQGAPSGSWVRSGASPNILGEHTSFSSCN